MGTPVATWSTDKKITETLERSVDHMPAGLKDQWDALLSAENLLIMSATMLLWAGSHAFGVGEIVDVGLLLVGAIMLGPAVGRAAELLMEASTCVNATSEMQIDKCAKALADAIVLIGVTTVLALLLRRGAKNLQATRGGPGASWLRVAKPGGRPQVRSVGGDLYDSGRVGLPKIGAADPQPGKFWSRYPAVPEATEPRGTGWTEWFGEVHYSTQGTWDDIILAADHEAVHSALTPRVAPLRTFRVQLKAAGYGRSALLRYLEEAMAEGYAQAKNNGMKGLLAGARFPVKEGYVTLTQMLNEGAALGTIQVGALVFNVGFVQGSLKTLIESLQDTPIVVGNDAHYIDGSWWMWADKWFWQITFNPDGRVRWTDPYNHQTGAGRWKTVSDGIEITWNGKPANQKDKWNGPIATSNTEGTVYVGGKAYSMTAKKIAREEIQQLAGKWRMRAGKYTWDYEFDAYGNVRWRDPNNGQNGMGLWSITKTSIYINWAPSQTREEWELPLNPDGQIVDYKASYMKLNNKLEKDKEALVVKKVG